MPLPPAGGGAPAEARAARRSGAASAGQVARTPPPLSALTWRSPAPRRRSLSRCCGQSSAGPPPALLRQLPGLPRPLPCSLRRRRARCVPRCAPLKTRLSSRRVRAAAAAASRPAPRGRRFCTLLFRASPPPLRLAHRAPRANAEAAAGAQRSALGRLPRGDVRSGACRRAARGACALVSPGLGAALSALRAVAPARRCGARRECARSGASRAQALRCRARRCR